MGKAIRFGIQAQLSLVVCAFSLFSLGVLSLATYFSNKDVVLQLRRDELTVIAQVKAAQIVEAMSNMAVEAILLSGGTYLQSIMTTYYSGGNVTVDVPDEINQFKLAAEASDNVVGSIIYSANLSVIDTVLVNSGVNLTLPYGLYIHPDVSPEVVAETSYVDHLAYVKGPERAGDSFLLSFTRAIVINNNGLASLVKSNITTEYDIVGFLTVIFLAKPILHVLLEKNMVDMSGSSILLEAHPRNATIEQINNVSYPITGDYVFNPGYCENCEKFEFLLPEYAKSAIFNGTSGSIIDYNSANDSELVSLGYAQVDSLNKKWAVIVRQDHSTIFKPLTELRNIILISLFTIGFGMFVLTLILSRWAVTPITRLQAATEQSMTTVNTKRRNWRFPYMWVLLWPFRWLKNAVSGCRSGPKITEKSLKDAKIDNIDASSPDNAAGYSSAVSDRITKEKTGTSWYRSIGDAFTRKKKVRRTETTSFRIPDTVPTNKYIENELTDLTKKFNEMTDELRKQYNMLEDRVQQRTGEIESAREAAETANQAKSLFIANITHELRTPLNGILGMTAVAMELDDPQQIKESLGIIFKSGELLLHLLTDLLAFSQSQTAGNMELEDKDFVMDEIMTQLNAIFIEQARSANIALKINLASEELRPVVFKGDINRILQVVINLVSNSLKFTPANGSVTLTIKRVEDPELSKQFRQFLAESSPSPKSAGADISESSDDQGTDISVVSHPHHYRSESTFLPPAPPSLLFTKDHDLLRNRASSPELRLNKSEPSTLAESSKMSRGSTLAVASSSSGGAVLADEFDIVSFCVEDTGPGIAPHLQSKIFEAFVQGDLALTKKRGGVGLGLSICRQLAVMMHGTVFVESELGKGSRFTFKVPLRKDKSTTSHDFTMEWRSMMVASSTTPVSEFTSTSKPSPVVSDVDEGSEASYFTRPIMPWLPSHIGKEDDKHNMLSHVRALVAEDNKVNQEVMSRMLKLEGLFSITVANDGQEAIQCVEECVKKMEKPFDIIFMDIQMPRVDGREASRIIRREYHYEGPIVAVSAFADKSNIEHSLSAGMNHFLAKPLRRPHLHKLLYELLVEGYEQESTTSSPTSPA